MVIAARKLNPSLVTEETGTVLRSLGAAFSVELGSGVVTATRAVSCLVAPLLGDRVLVAVEASGKAYVLAVLERAEEDGKTTLSVDGDLEIRTASGACSIAAQDGVQIASPGEVKVAANTLNVTALEGKVVTEKLTFMARWMLGELGKLKVIAESVDSVVSRVSQRVERSYRTVTELDQVKAHQMDYTAEEQLRMHAKNTLMTSDNLVKVDGDQIHFG
ncbi:DUF3540 domain-containing protein [Chondromyces crocatus]|uniref:DUF3540 domain-containing protein n=1 Tax=Chondromyces crocatus TaxID=52 RepID=A0A0K1EKU8_CHOCO|nr:DUF3540 domain-containing protein [Chondromyces crocatus]AKT41277.1 uncharacterized protein CMC5_054440 [Chondromyces crocatus]